MPRDLQNSVTEKEIRWMTGNNITSYTIVNEQGKTTVAVGDTVTIHTFSGGGMGGCRVVKLTNRGLHYTQDDGKHIKTIAYDRIYSLEVDYEATNR